MVSKERSFDEFILDQIPEQKYDQANFASLSKEIRTFLNLLYPNPADKIAYLASDYYEKATNNLASGWMGVVKTRDTEDMDALLIVCQPAKLIEDEALLEEARGSFKILASVLRSFFRIESMISLFQNDRDSAILVAQAYFGSKPTHIMEWGSIAPLDTSWPATLIWEQEFNQA